MSVQPTPSSERDAGILAGLRQGVLLGLAVLVLVLPMRRQQVPPEAPPAVTAPAPRVQTPPAPPPIVRRLDFRGERPTASVHKLATWVVSAADNGDAPFVILDKRDARVWVFDREGGLDGVSPVLLGYARGDHTVPGIGDRPIEQVRPSERTTPAGRFVAERGRNTLQEDVIWVDYDAAVSMHRVRPTNPKERRLERLATPTSADNRISYGCINVPVPFFESVLWPRFSRSRGIVYVLPEVQTMESVFPALATMSTVPLASATVT